MTQTQVCTQIRAAPELCFDLARDVAVHARSLAHTGERATERPALALLELGDEVAFESRHVGVRQRLRARIDAFDPPHWFRDSMGRGAHDLRFEETSTRTRRTDRIRFRAPLWRLRAPIERVVPAPSRRRLIATGAGEIRADAERRAASEATT